METMEMPMSQGVVQDLGSLESQPLDMENTFDESFESTEDVTTVTTTVDTLLENAEAEGQGFEQILEKIADGEFEEENDRPEDTIDEEQAGEDQPEEEEGETEEPTDEKEKTDPEEEMDEDEWIELNDKIDLLEEKVDSLIEETKELTEKIDQIKGEARMSQKEFLEMLLLLYKIMKEEDNRKKKLSFLEFMIKLVGIFMQSLADPESVEKNKEKEQAESTESSSKEPESVLSMMEYLEKRNALPKSAPQQLHQNQEASLSADSMAA